MAFQVALRNLLEIPICDLTPLDAQKEFNEVIECRPSFEQIGQDRIVDEVNKDIHILKAFETILEERVQSFKSFLQSLRPLS
jgi:hypothetical protein